MKAVILAAGEGTRMRPLTDETPKPLLPVAGKPIIQHTIDLLDDYVDEIIVVAGYLSEDIEDYFSGTDVKIVEQLESKGTAHAALQARGEVDGKTLIINGDDVYDIDMSEIESMDQGIVASRLESPEKYGVLGIEGSVVKNIEEKPQDPSSDLVNAGFYVVQEDFFELLENVERSERGEYEITDAISEYIRQHDFEFVEADRWIACSYPWQLIEANEQLLEDQDRRIEGEVAESATIGGGVVVEDGAEIRENTVIEGPALIKSGARVGPSAYIRGSTTVHEDAEIVNSEVKNSVIRAEARAPHFNYIGDSYISQEVNLGGGAKIANVLNDGRNIRMMVKGELLDTGMEKMGAIIASGAKLGSNTVVNPGRKIGSGAVTDSNEKVEQNLPSGAVLKNGDIIEDRD